MGADILIYYEPYILEREVGEKGGAVGKEAADKRWPQIYGETDRRVDELGSSLSQTTPLVDYFSLYAALTSKISPFPALKPLFSP